MENINEENAKNLLKSLDTDLAMRESAVDEFVYGETILEITPEGIRCVRFGTKEYNEILKRNGKTN